MKRSIWIIAAAMLLGPAVSLAGAQAAAAQETSGFPACVAGTYLGEVTPDLGLAFQNLNTFGRDGTFVTESTIDFGAGGTAFAAFRSGGRGHWRMIGPSRLKTAYLHFAYDSTGALLWVEKISAVETFSGGCLSATGEATYSIYLPNQDPLGDDPPVAGGSATLVMRRVPLN